MESVDALDGRRRRSRLSAEAVSDKLSQARLIGVVKEVAGSLSDVEIPGWETSEAAAQWVRDSRHADEALPAALRRP